MRLDTASDHYYFVQALGWIGCGIARDHQSTAQPFCSRNSSQACLSPKFGRNSAGYKGSLVIGSIGCRRRASKMEALSYDLPVLVCFACYVSS